MQTNNPDNSRGLHEFREEIALYGALLHVCLERNKDTVLRKPTRRR